MTAGCSYYESKKNGFDVSGGQFKKMLKMSTENFEQILCSVHQKSRKQDGSTKSSHTQQKNPF